MNVFSPNLPNLRHLSVLTLLAQGHSVHAVARLMHVSQPAVTLALSRIEVQFNAELFERSPRKGLTITPYGDVLERRARRLIARLEAGTLAALRHSSAGELGDEAVERSRYIVRRLSTRKVQAVAALANSPNSRIAAERLGITQASLRRLVTDVQDLLGVEILSSDHHSVRLTESGQELANAYSLGLREIESGNQDLRELDGDMGGTVAVGSTMLPTVELLPKVLLELNRRRPQSTVHVVFAAVSDMVEGLRRGELDAVCSTDRPEQMQEFETRELFSGHIRIYARRGHPLEGVRNPSAAVLSRYSWITPGARTVPGRRLREMLEGQDGTSPNICLETLVQELATRVLLASDHLLIWAGAADTSILGDGLVEIEKEIPVPSRPVWLIYRSDWEPTGAQRLFLDLALEQANILKELNK